MPLLNIIKELLHTSEAKQVLVQNSFKNCKTINIPRSFLLSL